MKVELFALILVAGSAHAQGPHVALELDLDTEGLSVEDSLYEPTRSTSHGSTPLRDSQAKVAEPPAVARYTARVPEGNLRLETRLERHSYEGLLKGRDKLDSADLAAGGYSVVGESMVHTTRSVDLFYGATHNMTVFASVPIHERSMTSQVTGFGPLDQTSSGIGDVVTGIVYAYRDKPTSKLHVHLGVGLPTGEIAADDLGADGTSERLPLPMQLGSGTYDIYNGATWVNRMDVWTMGVHGRMRIHFGENDEGWARGDSFNFDLWIARPVFSFLDFNLRVQNASWGDYYGTAPASSNPDDNPLAEIHRQGGTRTDGGMGLALDLGPVGRISVDATVPIDEWLDGPQFSTQRTLSLSWHLSF
ncbi:MAG: hypothetical protein OSB57_12475 [Planctomycetota bacterium]|nr:hypothetical protein [Planctomycetota bacterium]